MNFRCGRAMGYLEIFHGGDVWMCCPDWTTEPLGNILKSDLLTMWQGPHARRVREGIARGDFSLCNRCSYQPAPFGPIEQVADDKVPEVERIAKVFIAFDRTCNLYCPTCRHGIFKYPWNNDREVRKLYDRVLSPGFLASVDCLRVLSSGEVFASALCQDMLHRLDWEGYPKLRLHFQTNGLLFTPERYEALGVARERLDSVSVSIDAATRETYALNRSRGNLDTYDTLAENLQFIAGLKALGVLQHFVHVMVVQANNFREMADFARQAFALGAEAEYMTFYNWGTFTDAEYAARAVHLPTHPEHEEFLKVLRDPLFEDPRIIKTNFSKREEVARWQVK